jgi:hypothetical protein
MVAFRRCSGTRQRGFRPRHPGAHPVPQVFDLVGAQFAPGRHFERARLLDSLNDPALLRFSGDGHRPAVAAARETSLVFERQPAGALFVAVTTGALLFEQRPDAHFEEAGELVRRLGACRPRANQNRETRDKRLISPGIDYREIARAAAGRYSI